MKDDKMAMFIREQRRQLEKLLQVSIGKYSQERIDTLKSEIAGLKIREKRYGGVLEDEN